jgi:Predicted phosphohydrolases
MKRRPSYLQGVFGSLRQKLSTSWANRSAARMVDFALVKTGWLPERLDGSGKLLHISDTPTAIYPYIARLLRRVNPSVVVHTGDLADDIKLEMYPEEAERYARFMRRLLNVLAAPHRTVYLTIGNHDRADLLPPLPPRCHICEDVAEISFRGVHFRLSHYLERLAGSPAKFNLFGHAWEDESYSDGDGRYFLNGVEVMRLIDPASEEIEFLRYPSGTENARHLRRRCGR